MIRQKVPTRQDGNFTVQYESLTGVMHFYWGGEKIYQKTIPECEKMFPHILWYRVKEEKHIRHIF